MTQQGDAVMKKTSRPSMVLRSMGCALLALIALSVQPTGAAAQGNPLVGVWQWQYGNATSELVIQPDLHFSKLDSQSGAQARISGIVSLNAEPPTLRLNIQDYEPKQFCGPRGCSPIQMIAAESYGFRLQGDQLVLSTSAGYAVFHRVH